MSKLRSNIVVGLVIVAAFFWGYKKDSIANFVQDFSVARLFSSPPAATGDSVGDKAKVEPPAPIAPSIPSQPVPAPIANVSPPPRLQPPPLPGQARPVGPAPTPPGSNAQEYVPPKNPYAGLSQQLQSNSDASFKEAFGSISRDPVSQKELMQKNSYFRQLSQDLNKLQGEQPPPPPAEGAAAENTTEEVAAPESVVEDGAGIPAAEEPVGEPELAEVEENVADLMDPLIDDLE